MSPRRHHVDQPVDQQLRRIAEDDALLEALARRDDAAVVPGHGDDVTTLLRALTVDVDTHAQRAASRPAVVPSVSLLPASDRRRRPMRVRRSTAALGLLGAIVAGSTGVAAAVTGDPFAGLTGLQRVIEVATSGRAEAPAEVPHAPSPGATSGPGAPGAVPAAPGGSPGGTITFAPVPTGPDGTGGPKPRMPRAVLPTTPARQAAPSLPSSSHPAKGSSEAGVSTETATEGHQQSKSAHEPEPTSASRAPKRPEPTDPPPAVEGGDHSGADQAPAPDPGRPGVTSSSPRQPDPATGASRSPQPPSDGD